MKIEKIHFLTTHIPDKLGEAKFGCGKDSLNGDGAFSRSNRMSSNSLLSESVILSCRSGDGGKLSELVLLDRSLAGGGIGGRSRAASCSG